MEKIIRYILIALVLVLLTALGVFAIRYSRDMGKLRSAYSQLEDRNRQLEWAATESRSVLDRIDGRIADATREISGAGSTVSKIKHIVSAIEAISLDLRERPGHEPSVERDPRNR